MDIFSVLPGLIQRQMKLPLILYRLLLELQSALPLRNDLREVQIHGLTWRSQLLIRHQLQQLHPAYIQAFS